ncbi:Protein kinase domain, partial [Dillenia turbinata]
ILASESSTMISKLALFLLDKEKRPKISDFGVAKIFEVTDGYMAPEDVMQGPFSVKFDVYSFGVLVLEIISGRRNSSFCQSDYASPGICSFSIMLPLPQQLAFFSGSRTKSEIGRPAKEQKTDQSTGNPIPVSTNEMSIIDLFPR